MSETQDLEAGRDQLAPQHPRGYTMADEEMERLESKKESGDVLDPIALDDPVGMSVEKVIARAAVAVVFVLVVGLLFAQVACKNIQKWGVTSFENGVSSETLEKALGSGVSWAGEIVKFPGLEHFDYLEDTGTVTVFVSDVSRRTFEQLVEAALDKSFVLAMAVMVDTSVNQIVYVVNSTVDPETGRFSASASKNSLGQVLSIVWERTEDGTFACEMGGYDPATVATKSKKE